MADNQLGVKTRAMTEKEGANPTRPEHQQAPTGPSSQQHLQPQRQLQQHNTDSQGAIPNPRVELTRINEENLEQYIRDHSKISLDWYVPNLLNTLFIDMIRNKIPNKSGENKIMFNSTELSKFFTISRFKLDLKTGLVHTYSTPTQDIGVACQQEEFNEDALLEHFQG